MGSNFWIWSVTIPAILLVVGASVTYLLDVKGETWKHRNIGYLILLAIALGSSIRVGFSEYQNAVKSDTIDSLRQNQMDTLKLDFKNSVETLEKQKAALELDVESLDSITKVLRGQSEVLSRQLDANTKIERVLGATTPPTISVEAHIYSDKLFHKDLRVFDLKRASIRSNPLSPYLDTANILADTFKVKGYIFVNLINPDPLHPMRNVRVTLSSPNYNRTRKDRRDKFVDLYQSSLRGTGEIRKTRDVFTILPSSSARAFEMHVNFDYSAYEFYRFR